MVQNYILITLLANLLTSGNLGYPLGTVVILSETLIETQYTQTGKIHSQPRTYMSLGWSYSRTFHKGDSLRTRQPSKRGHYSGPLSCSF